jgi:enoyl-CoA hydratase/carnithine racemase
MSEILVENAGDICRITINRPDKRNALTGAMYDTMADALREAAARPGIRVVFITGGPQYFCAGNDINDFRARVQAPGDEPSPARNFLTALRECPKPIVAAVTGIAVGIGVTMLLHCDLVYAAESAVFAMPFVDLALCPEGGSSLLLAQRAGALLANELLMLGAPFDGATALRARIVNAVLADADLLAIAEEKARILAAKPPAAMEATKALLRRADAARLAEQMDEEFAQFANLLRGPESAEALAAFTEKRKPDFSRFSS